MPGHLVPACHWRQGCQEDSFLLQLVLGPIFWLRDFERGLFIICCILRTALLSGWVPIFRTVYRVRILPVDLFL